MVQKRGNLILIILGILAGITVLAVLFFSNSGITGNASMWNKIFSSQSAGGIRDFSLADSNDAIIIDAYSERDDTKGLSIAKPVYGMSIDADVEMNSDESLIRVVLVDKSGVDYLIYEGYPLISDKKIKLSNYCEETCALDGDSPDYLRIEVSEGSINIRKINILADKGKLEKSALEKGIKEYNKEKKIAQNKVKINLINRKIKDKGMLWVAGETSVSSLSFNEKKKLFPNLETVPNLEGFEYYAGGIFSAGILADSAVSAVSSESVGAGASAYVGDWDWRKRHGQNWLPPMKDQGSCGSCWDFAAVAATETATNLYFNQHLNINLAEQDVLSCAGAGSCSGGYPDRALNYIRTTGIVDEACFPYKSVDASGCGYYDIYDNYCNNTPVLCSQRCASPANKISIAGTLTSAKTDDALKKMIIQQGGVAMTLNHWSHAMQVIGYGTIKGGDYAFNGSLADGLYHFYIIPEGHGWVGLPYYTFKNSWGGYWGEAGYGKVIFTNISTASVSWLGVQNPVTSLQPYHVSCVDADNDQYCNWGIGSRPSSCPSGCAVQPDCDDSNSSLGFYNLDYSCSLISQESGSISVTSSPAGADAYVDGIFGGVTPAVINKVATGSHSVRISKAGYSDYTANVDVTTNQVSNVNAVLSEVGEGSLSVTSVPSGANFYLNGIYKGKTPLLLSPLSTSSYSVILSYPGYYNYTGTASVMNQQTTYVNVNMTKIPMGTVYVASTPKGVAAVIDNTYTALTPFRMNLSVGTHSLLLSKRGYNPYTATFNIAAGQTTNMNVILNSTSSGGKRK